MKKEQQTEKERIDEALELLWLLEEEKSLNISNFKKASDDKDFDKLFSMLKDQNLVSVSASTDGIKFTEKGRLMAKKLIRRHRLAEQLLTQVFDLKVDSADKDACKMEHILSEGLTESVCTFLGHPPKCPHGKPIPRGECCKRYKIEMKPLVVSLNDFEIGSKGRIVFIAPSSETSRLTRLGSMGIIAGSAIKLIQKKPSFVIQIDETTIAIDPDIAKEIFVKKTS